MFRANRLSSLVRCERRIWKRSRNCTSPDATYTNIKYQRIWQLVGDKKIFLGGRYIHMYLSARIFHSKLFKFSCTRFSASSNSKEIFRRSVSRATLFICVFVCVCVYTRVPIGILILSSHRLTVLAVDISLLFFEYSGQVEYEATVQTCDWKFLFHA